MQFSLSIHDIVYTSCKIRLIPVYRLLFEVHNSIIYAPNRFVSFMAVFQNIWVLLSAGEALVVVWLFALTNLYLDLGTCSFLFKLLILLLLLIQLFLPFKEVIHLHIPQIFLKKYKICTTIVENFFHLNIIK